MPRESVYGTDDSGYAVKVGWERDKHVQVGVGGPVEFTFTTPLPEGVTVAPTYDGLWVTMTRQGINDLIRHLRRARDAAFGADQ